MGISKDENRLFENVILEGLARVNVYAVIISFSLISLGNFIFHAIRSELSLAIGCSLFVLGLVFYSLAEYLIHRFLYHSPKKKGKTNSSQFLHKIHHDHPRDKKSLALPLPVALLLAAGFYYIFLWLMGNAGPFFFSGFVLGYGLYIAVHLLIHTRRPPANRFRILWNHHHIHHHRDDRKAFGVITTLWDIVFGTMPKINRS